jgi:RNA polymerase sigma-70 factor (ECF subfamily)
MALGQNFDRVLLAAKTGEEWAVASLYKDLSGPVLNYLRIQDPQEGEDLASETWIDVAKALPRFEGAEEDFRRFVFAIAHRRLVDHRRRLFRRKTHPAPSELIEPHLPTGDVESEALDGLARREAMARIRALPPDQAEVLLLRVFAGLSATEVGRLLGKRPVTVRVLQHRALARLAADLAEFDVTTEQLRTM